ncbi:hypothetical protein K438DRAFT_1958888 [Mycena galopus ATCC 62051]|nr:hypothetical protein K438DRAFT_1958888 [Mycena galopus ATCC 62051]
MPRNTIRIAAVLGLVFLGFWLYKQLVRPGSIKFSESGRRVGLNLTKDEVWVFEEFIHDEVNGAIGVSLQAANVVPTFACHFRHGFQTVLSAIMKDEPTLVAPNGPALANALAADTIDNLILTTCTESMKRHHKIIHASSANVVCLVHHSDANELKPLIEPLAAQGRLSLLVLGEHVRQAIQADINDWIENMGTPIWENVPLEVMIPVFDYPGLAQRPEPALLADLKASFLKSPSIWGWNGTEGSAFQPVTGASPFTLHLVGQANPADAVVIPVELQDVVQIHPGLPYLEFYRFISEADIMLPTFKQRGSYEDSASSSIAAAAITRIPVLASPRHLSAYTYLTGPSVLHRKISTSEVGALEALRAGAQPRRRASSAEWDSFQNEIIHDNAEMWARILR